MTQPVEDLERALAEIDAAPLTQTHDVVMRHWLAIRATLDRERELREALVEVVAAKNACDNAVDAETLRKQANRLSQAFRRGRALLAQPAAREERER